MKTRLPALSTWLLKRVGPRDWTESVTQELVKMSGQGFSSASGWKRIGRALADQIWRDVRKHKLLAVSGVITGWAVLGCSVVLVSWLTVTFGGPWVHAARWYGPQQAMLLVAGVAYSAFSGWVVGQLHRTHRPMAVFSYLGSVLVASVLAPPLYYWLAPSLFFSTIVAHLPFHLITFVAAPISIVGGGLWSASERTQTSGIDGP